MSAQEFGAMIHDYAQWMAEDALQERGQAANHADDHAAG
jgi:hypothetical protein